MRVHSVERVKGVSNNLPDMQWRIEFFKARFAGALDSKYRRKEIDQFDDYAYHRFVQSPLSPILPLPMRLLPRKKRGKIACVVLVVALSSSEQQHCYYGNCHDYSDR